MHDTLRFNLTGLARVCSVLLAVMVLAELCIGAFSYRTLVFLSDIEAGALTGPDLETAATQIDSWGLVVGVGYIALFVLTAIFCGVWIYRASWNAREIQPEPDRIKPGWAVGWYFVPLLAYWMPFKAMVQTGNSSDNPEGDIDDSPPGFVLAWWIMWVISSIGGTASFRLSNRAETIGEFRFVTWLDLALVPISILSTLLFMRVIKTITSAQQDKRPATPRAETMPSEEGKLS